ncbi:hypothetical protein, partial [Klebsiella pneumoniae]|uniref:hypothetical protein n=1 Tax=Klebsiella pneumoniae TaxID=573 RepID=UPI002DB66AD0
ATSTVTVGVLYSRIIAAICCFIGNSVGCRFGLCYRAAVLPPDKISIAFLAPKVNISKYNNYMYFIQFYQQKAPRKAR